MPRKNKKKAPRPPDILRKGGPMKDKTKYDRKRDKQIPGDETKSGPADGK